jgi:hypothetical protein
LGRRRRRGRRLLGTLLFEIFFVIFLFFLQLWGCEMCSSEISQSRQTQFPFRFGVFVILNKCEVTNDWYQHFVP